MRRNWLVTILVVLLSLSGMIIPGATINSEKTHASPNVSSTPVLPGSQQVVQNGLNAARVNTQGASQSYPSTDQVSSAFPKHPVALSRALTIRWNTVQNQGTPNPPTYSASSLLAAANISKPNQSVITVLSSFDGLNQITSCACFPPDPIMAAGPNYLVEMVNIEGAYYTKQGSLVKNFTLASFFNSGSDFISDPKVIYDASSGRWFASIIDLVGFNPNTFTFTSGTVKVAISITNDPTVNNSKGIWNLYTFNFGTYLPDQPILGVNDDKLVVSVNDFAGFGGFVGAQYVVLNKADMVNGASLARNASFGPFGSQISVHPVLSLTPTTTEYMVSTGCCSTTRSVVQVFNITGVPGVSAVPVPIPRSLNISLIGTQLSGVGGGCVGPAPCSTILPNGPDPAGGQVNTDDIRVADAVWSKGKIWLGLNDACIPSGDSIKRACFRLTQIDTTSPLANVRQDFDVGANNQYYFYPALRTDGTGNLNVVYGFSSTTNSTCCYPSLAVTGQAVNDTLGTLVPPQILKLGSASDTSSRYGDYFGAALDPSDQSTVWVNGEYHTSSTGFCNGGPCWSTFIGSTRIVGFTISANPTYLNIAQGTSGSSTITLASIGSFNGTVSLSSSVSSGGPTATLNPGSVYLAPGKLGTSTLTITAGKKTASGLYNVTITAVNGVYSYPTLVAVRVGPDYTISANPNSLTFTASSSGSSTITLISFNAFIGTVSLVATISPSGPTTSVSPPTVSLSSGGTGTSTLSIVTTGSTAAGTYVVSVAATGGSILHSTTVTVNVVGYILTASPTAETIPAATQGFSILTVKSISGFSGSIALSATVSPSGPTMSFSPVTLALASGGTNASRLTISTTAFTAAGSYIITVTGASGPQTHTATITVTVTGDFNLLSNPPSITFTAGSIGNSTITVNSVGLVGTVRLSGATSNPGLTASLTSVNVTLTAGSSGSSTLRVSATGSTAPGTYTVTVTATSGSLSHSITVSINLAGYAIFPNPSAVVFQQGSSGTSVITVSSVNGFAGTVNLAFTIPPNSNLTSSITPTSVTIASGGSATSTLTLNGQSFGTFNTHLAGTSVSLSQTISITVGVGGLVCIMDATSALFAVACPSPPQAFSGPLTSPVTQLRVGVFLSGSPRFGFFAVTLLTDSSVLQPTGVDLGGSVIGTNPFSLQECIGGQGFLPACQPPIDNANTISVIAVGNLQTGSAGTGLLFTAIYNIVGTGTPTITFQTGCSGSSLLGTTTCVSLYDTTFGNLMPDAIQTGSFTTNEAVPFVTLSGNPGSIGPVMAGISKNSIVTATSQNNYPGPFDSGTVTLSISTPAGLSAFLNTTNVFPIPNQPSSANATITGSSAGMYTLTIFGTYTVTNTTTGITSTLVATMTISINVQDYSMSANPTTITLNRGSGGTATITITSLNSFKGTVALSSLVSPVVTNGPTVTLNPTSITLTANGQLTSTASISTTASTPPRLYSVLVRGSANGTIRQAVIRINVIDFTISASPSTASMVLAGASTTSNITLTSLNLAGSVSLGVSVSPSGSVVSLWPYTVTLAVGGTATSTLSISAGAATPGNYIMTVTGTSGTLVHSANVTIQITGDFAISANPTLITVPAGSSGSTTLTATSQAGFSGEVYFGPFANVVINATAWSDSACRGFGLTFDQPLPSNFQTSLPNSVIGASCTGKFDYSTITGIALGSNFLEFGVNATAGHWHVKIYVNGVQLANVDTNASHFVHAGFQSGTISSIFAAGWSSTIILSNGGSGSMVVTFTTSSTTPAGNYPFTVTGTSGGLSRLISGTIQVTDFSIAASPTSIAFNANSTATLTVTVASLNHFSGTVNLSTSVSNSSVTVSCSPTSVTLAAGGTASSTCTLSSLVSGTYIVTITSTSGGLSHKATVTATVRDFSVSASPNSLTIARRNSGTSTITIASLNGYSGSASLSVAVYASPADCTPPVDPCFVSNPPTASLSPTTVSISSGGSGTSTLTVSTGTRTNSGSYTIIVTVTSGSITHAVTISLTVT